MVDPGLNIVLMAEMRYNVATERVQGGKGGFSDRNSEDVGGGLQSVDEMQDVVITREDLM